MESLYISYLYDKLNYVCIYMGSYSWSIAFFFFSYKRNRFHVLVGLYSDGSELKIINDTCLCLVCPFLFLPCFGVICSLLPNRCTATWNLFVKIHFCNPADFSGCKIPKSAQWDILFLGNPHNKTCGCFWCSGVTGSWCCTLPLSFLSFFTLVSVKNSGLTDLDWRALFISVIRLRGLVQIHKDCIL